MSTSNDSKLLLIEVAELLRMSTRKVRKLAEAGKIPHIALPDRELLFDRGEIEQWLHSLRKPVQRRGEVTHAD